jgi:hypothetical protein
LRASSNRAADEQAVKKLLGGESAQILEKSFGFGELRALIDARLEANRAKAPPATTGAAAAT